MAVWLDAHQDPVAAIHTTPSCIRCASTPPHLRPPARGLLRAAPVGRSWPAPGAVHCTHISPTARAPPPSAPLRTPRLCDVTGDGDPKLLVADQNRKLRLYKGINLVSEHALVTQTVGAGCDASCWRRGAGGAGRRHGACVCGDPVRVCAARHAVGHLSILRR